MKIIITMICIFKTTIESDYINNLQLTRNITISIFLLSSLPAGWVLCQSDTLSSSQNISATCKTSIYFVKNPRYHDLHNIYWLCSTINPSQHIPPYQEWDLKNWRKYIWIVKLNHNSNGTQLNFVDILRYFYLIPDQMN